MADKGIYTAVSGAMAQSTQLESIANNIANANTPSFKRDSQVFKEYLTSYEKAPDVIKVPRVPASIESFYDMNGGDKSYVDVVGTYTDFNQGTLKPTGNPLDLALEGRGFFEVLTPSGTQLTRQGSLVIDSSGRLVTKEGYPILKSGGDTLSDRLITLNPKLPVSVGTNGQIVNGDQPAGSLSLVSVENINSLRKVGSSRYTVNDGYPAATPVQTAQVNQGFQEMSNVNIVREMTELINTHRTFETTQKAIQAYDQMDAKMINEIPKF